MSLTRRLFHLTLALIFIFSLVPVIGLHPTASVQAASGWVKSPITLPNQKYVLDSTVIKDGSTYKMWYTYVKMSSSLEALFGQLKGLHLDSLVTDLQNYNFNAFFNHLTDLNQDISTLRALFGGIAGTIGYATSTDGMNWTVQNANALQGMSGGIWTSVGFPSVIKVDDTHYKMWFTRLETSLTQTQIQTLFTNLGVPSQRRTALDTLLNSTKTVIGYATSTNGSSWTVENPTALVGTGGAWDVFNSVMTPSVMFEGGIYRMWYSRPKTTLTGTDLDTLLGKVQTGNLTISDLANVLDHTTFVIGYADSTDGSAWTIRDNQVLTGGTSLWQSVLDPCVIRTGLTYEMWYTNGVSNMTQSLLQSVVTAMRNLGVPALWNSLKVNTFGDFFNDLVNLNVTNLKTLLNQTSTTIGYATSTYVVNWTIQSPSELTGVNTTPWSGISAPSVVKSSTPTSITTEMWFSRGIDDLTSQNLANRALGSDLGLGYASVVSTPPPPSGGGGGGGGPPLPTPGTTSVLDKILPNGLFIEDVIAKSVDGMCSVTIPKDTIGLTSANIALREIKIIKMDSPPSLPPDFNAVGFFYELGPDGAKFNPPVTISLSYKGMQLPPSTAENDIVIVWKDAQGKWSKLESTVDTVNKVVTAKISHFTPFGLLVPSSATAFTTTKLTISPAEAQVNQQATVSIVVTNTGELGRSFDIALMIDGAIAETKKVALASGASDTVTFTVTKSQAGTYNIVIGTQSGKLYVREAPTIPAPPRPTAFTTSNLTITPSVVKPGDVLTVSVTITNTGSRLGTYTVTLKVNGIAFESRDVALAGGGTQKIDFSVTESQPGTYSLSVDTLSGTFIVQTAVPPPTTPPAEKPKPNNWPIIIGGITGGILGLFLALLVMRYLRRPATFSISSLAIMPPVVKPGATATVLVKVTNTGNRQGTYKVVLKVNNITESSRDLSLRGGDSQTVNFTVVKNNPGIYVISIDTVSGRLVVQEPTETTSPQTGRPRPRNWPGIYR